MSVDSDLLELLRNRAESVAAPEMMLEVPPPEGGSRSPTTRVRRAVRVDFQRREEQNRRLGLAGEHLVVRHEKTRLTEAGRSDLAALVEHVAETQGDGLGYDVRSYDEQSGANLYIEVKTTNGSIEAPFLVTRNEVEFSEEEAESYALYHIFDFGGDARFYVRRGSRREHFTLTEKVFLASPLPSSD